MTAFLIHIYYRDSWTNIFRDQLKLQSKDLLLLVNLCRDMEGYQQVVAEIKADFPTAFIIVTPNIGKDIGGKMALIDLFIKTDLKADYLVLLHDKVSPHAITGERWRNKLFGVIQPSTADMIRSTFDSVPSIGIMGAADFIRNEYDEKKKAFQTTNNDKLFELIEKYQLKPTSYTFIAGTMFWIRASIVRSFFSAHSALQCREMLEAGDLSDQHVGTYTHSWERVLCWLAANNGYIIKGVSC